TKLVLYGLAAVTHGDYRAGMVLSALLLCAAALVLILVAERVRVSAAYGDAVFPLLLLHWGHRQNVLQYSQLFFVGVVVAYLAALSIIVADGWRGRPLQVAALGAALALLPLHGLMGLVYVTPLAGWTAYATAARWRAGTPAGRRDGRL